MNTKLLSAVALMSSTTSWALAQAPPVAPTPAPTVAPTAAPTPEPPKAPPELTKLHFLVGDWVHDEVHHGGPGGIAGRGAARSRLAWILGGHRLYLTYKSLGPEGEYEGRGLFGWDAEEKSYRLDWFDSRGLAQRYIGGFDPDDALVLSGESSRDGGPARQQLTIRKQPGGKFLLTDESAAGDQPMKLTLESLAQAAPAATPAAGASPAGDAAKAPGGSTPAGEAGKATPGGTTGKGVPGSTPTATPTPR